PSGRSGPDSTSRATSRSRPAKRSSSPPPHERSGRAGVPRSAGRHLRGPERGAPMIACATIAARAGVGLAGDRYALGTGTFSARGGGPRDVTLIEREAVDAVRADGLDVTEADTRRNLVTEGVPLDRLVGCTFRIGAVRVRGLRLA